MDPPVVIVSSLLLFRSWVGSALGMAGCEAQPRPHHTKCFIWVLTEQNKTKQDQPKNVKPTTKTRITRKKNTKGQEIKELGKKKETKTENMKEKKEKICVM